MQSKHWWIWYLMTLHWSATGSFGRKNENKSINTKKAIADDAWCDEEQIIFSG